VEFSLRYGLNSYITFRQASSSKGYRKAFPHHFPDSLSERFSRRYNKTNYVRISYFPIKATHTTHRNSPIFHYHASHLTALFQINGYLALIKWEGCNKRQSISTKDGGGKRSGFPENGEEKCEKHQSGLPVRLPVFEPRTYLPNTSHACFSCSNHRNRTTPMSTLCCESFRITINLNMPALGHNPTPL
jgi:hypothetical protein